jgi:Uma2 family endonuclease
MGDALKKNHRYSVEEYEALTRHAGEGERYEYADGQLVVKDEYTTDEHNLILLNIYRLLYAHFHPKGCKVFTENVRLAIDAHNQFRLPDVMVTCSPRDHASGDAKRDPLLLVEVLSASSSFVDLVDKVKAYKTIPALQAYLIVKPDKVWVRVYQRDAQGGWNETEYERKTEIIRLQDLHIPLQEVYLGSP